MSVLSTGYKIKAYQTLQSIIISYHAPYTNSIIYDSIDIRSGKYDCWYTRFTCVTCVFFLIILNKGYWQLMNTSKEKYEIIWYQNTFNYN